jgi:hypothetical protein
MDKDISRIPKGIYCYDEKGICPYWSINSDLPKQENGVCSFLNDNDYSRNEQIGRIECKDSNGFVSFFEPHEVPMSLLFDQIKECDVNMDDENELL